MHLLNGMIDRLIFANSGHQIYSVTQSYNHEYAYFTRCSTLVLCDTKVFDLSSLFLMSLMTCDDRQQFFYTWYLMLCDSVSASILYFCSCSMLVAMAVGLHELWRPTLAMRRNHCQMISWGMMRPLSLPRNWLWNRSENATLRCTSDSRMNWLTTENARRR